MQGAEISCGSISRKRFNAILFINTLLRVGSFSPGDIKFQKLFVTGGWLHKGTGTAVLRSGSLLGNLLKCLQRKEEVLEVSD